MENIFILEIGQQCYQKEMISNILGIIPNNENYNWGYGLIEKENDNSIDYINIFLDILEDKYEQLEMIGITREQITIWRIYEYNHQCNMEFEPQKMKRLGDNGITLCISCYDVGTYEEGIEE